MAIYMAAHMARIGSAVDPRPTASPAMIFVPAPVCEDSAILRIGRAEVKYSVTMPMKAPQRHPATTA